MRANVPNKQGSQAELPATLANEPAWHELHWAAPPALKEPGSQGAQLVEELDPEILLAVPLGQGMQEEPPWPLAVLKRPAAQGVQFKDDVAPTASRKSHAAQGVH